MLSKSESKNFKDCEEVFFVGVAVEEADVTMAVSFDEVVSSAEMLFVAGPVEMSSNLSADSGTFVRQMAKVSSSIDSWRPKESRSYCCMRRISFGVVPWSTEGACTSSDLCFLVFFFFSLGVVPDPGAEGLFLSGVRRLALPSCSGGLATASIFLLGGCVRSTRRGEGIDPEAPSSRLALRDARACFFLLPDLGASEGPVACCRLCCEAGMALFDVCRSLGAERDKW